MVRRSSLDSTSRAMSMMEIVIAIFIIGVSLVPILMTFSSSNLIVEVGIEDFESVSIILEIQEQVRQFPFAKAKSLPRELPLYEKGKQPNHKLAGGLEVYFSPPAESCLKITLKTSPMTFTPPAASGGGPAEARIIFLIIYEVEKHGAAKNNAPRRIVVPGVILP